MTVLRGVFPIEQYLKTFFFQNGEFEFLLDNVPKVVSSHWGDVGDAAILEHQ